MSHLEELRYTGSNAVSIRDGANLDAFSRLRTSHPVGLFSDQCQYDASPLLFEGSATGTGTAPAHNSATRMVALVTTAGTGTSGLQSYEYIPYQAGKSQLIFVTGLLGVGAASAVVDVGLFDTANGIFLRQNGTSGLQFVRRTSTSGGVVNNTVNQEDWNLDKLDGTGTSRVTLDPAAVFILVIDAQFLGMGRVRIGFDIGGVIIYAHEFRNANVLTVPYMQSLTLPIRMVVSTTSAAKTSYFKCAAVSSEGGFADDIGYQFATPEGTVTAASGARTAILSLRPRTTFNSITNRSRLRVDAVDLLVTGSNPIYYEICLGCTFSVAPTFANVNATYSATEYSSAAGTLSGVGIVIAAGYLGATATVKGPVESQLSAKYPITLDASGAQRAMGTVTVVVSGVGGTSATRCSLTYTEIR